MWKIAKNKSMAKVPWNRGLFPNDHFWAIPRNGFTLASIEIQAYAKLREFSKKTITNSEVNASVFLN
jgi:hypothetical protein